MIGDTGTGKTTLVDWLVDVLGGALVLTPKKKPHQWRGLKVVGCTPQMFNYQAILEQLQSIHKQMYHRYNLIEQGQEPPLTNFVVDEWRLIKKHVPQAKELMKDIITVAREAGFRMVALAQGTQVETWGFEGESDLEGCFTDILLGEFALQRCITICRRYPKNSPEYLYWTQALDFLKQADRPCIVADTLATVPNLTNWQRTVDDQAPESNAVTASQALGEPLRTIWNYCKQQSDWVSTRDVLRKDFAVLKDADTEAVKQYFFILINRGFGEIDQSNGSVKIRVF